ncbi:hypothetical protein KR054_003891 [Drosophila jambulina]|nr:hypothetical protein KR054_003891 [Drosophila jambulina]
MFFKTFTLFLAIGAACGSAVPSAFEITEETTLTDFLLHSPVLRSGESFNAGCFDYYLPVIKGHADQLDVDYAVCQDSYDNAYVLIDGSYSYARDELKEQVRSTCGSLVLCDAENTNSKAFECLVSKGPSSSKNLDDVSDKAADHNNSLLEKVGGIKKTLSECQVSAQRKYKASHAQSLEEMNACLADPEWDYPTTTASVF